MGQLKTLMKESFRTASESGNSDEICVFEMKEYIFQWAGSCYVAQADHYVVWKNSSCVTTKLPASDSCNQCRLSPGSAS